MTYCLCDKRLWLKSWPVGEKIIIKICSSILVLFVVIWSVVCLTKILPIAKAPSSKGTIARYPRRFGEQIASDLTISKTIVNTKVRKGINWLLIVLLVKGGG